MASLQKNYDTQKLLGQIYTPRFVVEKILSDINFNDTTILGKTILDPSCGDGRFLVVIAEKIINLSDKENLKKNLEKIYGWDIDNQAIENCKINLDFLVRDLDIKIDWNITLCNSLYKIAEDTQKYDFIVGNPPYIRIQHLEDLDRKYIQTFYTFCKSGSTDTYIAFYELCNKILAKNGLCALITPNTFFYSETAKILRSYFARHQNIVSISNYGDIQLFDNATTYSAIMIFGNEIKDNFTFEQAQTSTTFIKRQIDFSEIKNEKIWQLSQEKNIKSLGIKLKDICKIHVGITTLCDKVYIFKIRNIEDEPDFVLAETVFKGLIKIEKGILKQIVKASKLKKNTDKITSYVLFPYELRNGKHQIIAETKLKSDFPFTYEYLLSVKDELDKRDNGKLNAVAWYAFGRSQGLDTSFGKKILFSPMNNKPNFIYYENEYCTFYSGYCIKYNGDTNFLLNQLNSERLENFIAVSSRDFRGGWKAYNKRVLEDFIIIPNEQMKAKNVPNNVQQQLF